MGTRRLRLRPGRTADTLALLVVLTPIVLLAYLGYRWVRSADPVPIDCQRVVSDPAGSLHDVGAIEADARRVGTSLGADVRVHTVATVPGGDLDALERRMEAGCPEWRRPDGGRRDDLLVVVVGPGDRKTGIYYGRSLSARLDPVHERIQTEQMNPRFKEGEFDAGLRAGLAALGAPDEGDAPRRPVPSTVVPGQVLPDPFNPDPGATADGPPGRHGPGTPVDWFAVADSALTILYLRIAPALFLLAVIVYLYRRVTGRGDDGDWPPDQHPGSTSSSGTGSDGGGGSTDW